MSLRIFLALTFCLFSCGLALADPAEPPAANEGEKEKWTSLSPQGPEMKPWEIIRYGGEGEISLEEGTFHLADGATMTGIRLDEEAHKSEFPKTDYEVRYEARRIMGVDFFGGITFPVGDSHANFIPGGWGGAVVGISTIDGRDASENETTKYMTFKDEQWYRFKIRVTDDRIKVWVDDEQVIDLETKGKKIAPRAEIDPAAPLGLYTWQSTAELRKMEYRKLEP